jgi:hypothetical protein
VRLKIPSEKKLRKEFLLIFPAAVSSSFRKIMRCWELVDIAILVLINSKISFLRP